MRALCLCVILAITVPNLVLAEDDDDHGEYAVSYDSEEWQGALEKNNHFVMFYAPWCGHCKRLGPTFDLLAKKYNDDNSEITIAKVDCTKQTAVCAENSVTGYPTLKYFVKGSQSGDKYSGGRDQDALDAFIQGKLDPEAAKVKAAAEEKPKEAKPDEAAGLAVLNADTFSSHIEKGDHFVKFYAPWCGHCKNLAPIWDKLADELKDDASVSIAKIDCTEAGSVCQDNGVRGYPTLKYFRDGKEVEKYAGGRDLASFKTYLKKMQGVASPDMGTDEEKVPEKKEEKKEEPAEVGGCAVLSPDNFEDSIKDFAFIKFYAPWCGHCKKLAPIWDDLATDLEGRKDVVIGKVDCTIHRDLCGQFEVRGYPTLLWFEKGEKSEKYARGRDLGSLKDYVTEKAGAPAAVEEEEEEEKPEEDAKQEAVLDLTAETFPDAIAKGTAFIKFFAPWCGHCKRMAPTWEELGQEFADVEGVTIAKVDCTTDSNRALCKEQGVSGYPTLIMFKSGKKVKEHSGGRDLESLRKGIMDMAPHDEL